MQGVELVQAVIAKVHEEGFGITGQVEPRQPLAADVVDALRFPNGAPLSPSLREWLRFDGTLVGWFDDLEAPKLERSSVSQLALRMYGNAHQAGPFSALEGKTLPGDCYPLPKGTLARRFLYVGEPDSIGEYPVLVMDVDGPPFVCVECPGFDVYLATLAGLVYPPRRVFGCFVEDETYGPRMREHIARVLSGRPSLKLGDEGFTTEVKHEVAAEQTVLLWPGDPLPEGFVVIEEIMNPVKGLPMRLAAAASAVRAPGTRKE